MRMAEARAHRNLACVESTGGTEDGMRHRRGGEGAVALAACSITLRLASETVLSALSGKERSRQSLDPRGKPAAASSTLFILYVAQGVPIGLFWFAIPSGWLPMGKRSRRRLCPRPHALPWTLKLVNGFIMDRYTFLAMGGGGSDHRRADGDDRAAGGLRVDRSGVTDILLLGIAGFVVNMATTFQDVAVDGMAVDVMEEGNALARAG